MGFLLRETHNLVPSPTEQTFTHLLFSRTKLICFRSLYLRAGGPVHPGTCQGCYRDMEGDGRGDIYWGLPGCISKGVPPASPEPDTGLGGLWPQNNQSLVD